MEDDKKNSCNEVQKTINAKKYDRLKIVGPGEDLYKPLKTYTCL